MSEEEQHSARESSRAMRRERRVQRRRLLLGVPLIVIGLAMIGAGAYVWFENGNESDAPLVAGTTQMQTTTTIPESLTTG